MSKRILVVDDHEVVRQGVRLILRSHPEWQVVAEAEDGVDAIEKIKSLVPDLVILDISMPKKDGIEVMTELKGKGLPSKILVLTMHDSKELSAVIRGSGAFGYVIKTQAARDLVHAVQDIFDGGMFFPPDTPPSLKVTTEKPADSNSKKSGMFRLKLA